MFPAEYEGRAIEQCARQSEQMQRLLAADHAVSDRLPTPGLSFAEAVEALRSVRDRIGSWLRRVG